MRGRCFALLPAIALALVACTRTTPTPQIGPPTAEDLQAGEFLLVTTNDGIGVVDASTGELRLDLVGAVAAPDWSELYRAQSDGTETTIEWIDAASGSVASATTIRGDLRIHVVSPDGRIALMPATPEAAWVPRTVTPLVILDVSSGEVQRFSLPGNLEPEAFSTDESQLFMLRYQPATAPTSYRVTSLTLRSGRVGAVFGPSKGAKVVENMTATRVHQAMSPSEDVLFTLYTNQPPEFLEGVATVDAEHALAFIHTLNLEYGTAVCIGLPKSFGTVSTQASALAASPDGRFVYAVDARHGVIASMRSRGFKVSEHDVDLSTLGHGPISASVSTDGATLFLAGSAGVMALDTGTFSPQPLAPTPGSVTGLALSTDGERLFASWDGGIGLLDPISLDTVGVLPSPAPEGAVTFVGAA
jgi:hypothetical protein